MWPTSGWPVAGGAARPPRPLLTVTVNPNPARVSRHPDFGYLDRDSIGIAWRA